MKCFVFISIIFQYIYCRSIIIKFNHLYIMDVIYLLDSQFLNNKKETRINNIHLRTVDFMIIFISLFWKNVSILLGYSNENEKETLCGVQNGSICSQS